MLNKFLADLVGKVVAADLHCKRSPSNSFPSRFVALNFIFQIQVNLHMNVCLYNFSFPNLAYIIGGTSFVVGMNKKKKGIF